MPIDYIPRTRELYRDFAPYRWVFNDDAPWTELRKPLAKCRVALIGSGGILYRNQPRFRSEDTSYRQIPKQARREDLSIWHFGYPTADAMRDPNCIFPLERLRELEAEGVIGELAEIAFSFMGGIYSSRRVKQDLAPRIIEELRDMRVEAFFLVPA
jgi:D-proline reductase (dithiol) PrdB